MIMTGNNYEQANGQYTSGCDNEFYFVGFPFCKSEVCPSKSQVRAVNLPHAPICGKAMGIAPEDIKNLEAILN